MKLSGFLIWRLFSISLFLLFIFLIIEVILPAYSNWSAQNDQISVLKAQIQLSTNWQQELVKLKREKKQLEDDSNSISQHIILSGLSDALKLLNDIAKQNDITILELRTGSSSKIEDFDQLSIAIDFEGSFHHIGNFLKQLEMKENPIQLTNLILNKADDTIISSLDITIILARDH
ncbi:MAG: type 4a pilus biogenesis protein PilO [Saprospiraceae bacterium]|nr:type 4a pilus biogenesis protein PilO [Saprospiraceae bacterium]